MITKKLSYAITAYNEDKELERLLNQLAKRGPSEDTEVVILFDQGNTTEEVYKVVDSFRDRMNIVTGEHKLNKKFGVHKNHLNVLCSGAWIFNIDADELVSNKLLDEVLFIIGSSGNTEGYFIPRINTVEGITMEHIEKYNWRINEFGWINWPDYQLRLYKNMSKIRWSGNVHEILMGLERSKNLPASSEYALIHEKQIKKQESQNAFYDTIN